jgi:transposase-like protein
VAQPLRRGRRAGPTGRSSAPLNSPKLTSTDIVGKIIYLRQSYHFGPLKISMYLKRYHDIEISSSGVWRVLVRLDMNRLPASQRYKRKQTRWKRYEKARPGHHVQIDVKFLEPLPGVGKRTYYQYTAIDDCTRLRVLRVYRKHDQKTAIQFLDYVLEKLPFQVETIQTDNGSEFQAAFHWHILDRGIKHTYIRPATPRLNGKASSAPTASTPRSSTGSSKESSSTTARCSRTSCKNGRTSTTSTGHTAAWAGRLPTNGSDKRHTRP